MKWRSILSAIVVISAGSLLHFAWQWSGRNTFVAVFAATNESTWEHLKLAFWPALALIPLQRKITAVLVQLRNATDPETGQRYAVKRYESEKPAKGDTWRHERITLKPVNPEFEPIVLTGNDEGDLQMIAELVEVLGGSE